MTKSYWHLSQKDLTLLENCPLQFQKNYWQKLNFILNLTEIDHAEWGKNFHTLMQQYSLGLPLEKILNKQPEYKDSLEALIRETQDIWNCPQIKFRCAEYELKLIKKNYIFTVVFDLLVLFENQAIIFDWKTYLQPPNTKKLDNNWQTKLYLYLLTENFNYKPEQISFTYWFVKLPHKPQSHVIKYSQKVHQKTEQELDNLLVKFEKLYNNYQSNIFNCLDTEKCYNCLYFQSLTQSNNLENNPNNLLLQSPLSLEDVEEVSEDFLLG